MIPDICYDDDSEDLLRLSVVMTLEIYLDD